MGRENQTELLLSLCAPIEVFHTPDQEPFAKLPVNEHKEIRPINGLDFLSWLRRQYFVAYNAAPSSNALDSAVATMATRATYEGPSRQVFLRIGAANGNIYVDLCNDTWEVVEITKSGWKVIKDSPVPFRRSRRMRSLPFPSATKKESIAKFWEFLNVESTDDFRLIVAFILSCFQPKGPFLALVLYGGQGSAKSTTVRAIRALVDPAEPPLRRVPQNGEDLMVSAKHNWLIAIDNMSFLTDEMSDNLCCLATGGGLSKRALFTDDEEHVMEATRPIVLNGISEFVTRGDLTSRSIVVSLPAIKEGRRRREAAFWDEFKAAQPKLLGAIFDAVSTSIKNANEPELQMDLRMMDAWHFVSGGEVAFGWERGTCAKAFVKNQDTAHEVVLGASLLTPMVEHLANIDWRSSPTKLWDHFTVWRTGKITEKGHPTSVQALMTHIRRLSPSFRSKGIVITEGRTSGSDSTRFISFTRDHGIPVAADASSPPDPLGEEGHF